MTEETKTLKELIVMLQKLAPVVDDIADRILKENPDLKGVDPIKGPFFDIGKIATIFTMDFLVYA